MVDWTGWRGLGGFVKSAPRAAGGDQIGVPGRRGQGTLSPGRDRLRNRRTEGREPSPIGTDRPMTQRRTLFFAFVLRSTRHSAMLCRTGETDVNDVVSGGAGPNATP